MVKIFEINYSVPIYFLVYTEAPNDVLLQQTLKFQNRDASFENDYFLKNLLGKKVNKT